MSFGSANPPSNDRTPLNVQTYRASSNESGKPVPYFCGKQRFALNFISDIFDEKAVAVTQTVGKQKSKVGYNYYASFAAVACHGVVDGLHDVRMNGDSVFAATTTIRIMTLVSSAGVATATTKNAHGMVTGQVVIINGVEQLEYNGSKTITVTDATHFTYPITGTPVSPATTPDNGKITAKVQLDPIIRGAEDYVDVTIPDYGVMRIYWGTETQTADAYLQTSGIAHPAYRGICYVVFHQLFLGFNQTSVQNLEVILSRYPSTSWLTPRESNGDTNLISLAVDLFTNRRAGCGQSDERIDTAKMVATADALDAEGAAFSPLITREQELRQVLGQAFEYVDAFPVFGADGKLGIDIIRPPVGAVTEIVDADLRSKPAFTIDDWSTVKTETRLSFTNRLLDYEKDAVGRPDAGARAITGEASSQTMDRSWITDIDVATVLQIAMNRTAALPKITGKLKLRKTAALYAALLPGAPFTLNYSLRNTANLIFRVDKRTWSDPAKPEFEIQFRADRSYLYA